MSDEMDVTKLVARLRDVEYEDFCGELLDQAADALERMAAENTQLTLRLAIANRGVWATEKDKLDAIRESVLHELERWEAWTDEELLVMPKTPDHPPGTRNDMDFVSRFLAVDRRHRTLHEAAEKARKAAAEAGLAEWRWQL